MMAKHKIKKPHKIKNIIKKYMGSGLISNHIIAKNDSIAPNPNVLLIGGIMAVLLFAAVVLWAAIPRKDDELVSDEEYREKH